MNKKDIIIVDGVPCRRKTTEVTEKIDTWAADLAKCQGVGDLVLTLQKLDIPFRLLSPGTPSQGRGRRTLDRWRLTVYALDTIKVEAYTPRGLVYRLCSELVDVGRPLQTIDSALNRDKKHREWSDLAELFREVEDVVRRQGIDYPTDTSWKVQKFGFLDRFAEPFSGEGGGE